MRIGYNEWQHIPGKPWLIVDPIVVNHAADYWIAQASDGSVIQSLYLGTPLDSLGEHAPLLLQDPNDHFLHWLRDHWGATPWGIALRSGVAIYELIHHLQSFITVLDPNGEEVLWRYHDPRLLADQYTAFNAGEREAFLGPLHAIAAPAPDGTLQFLGDPKRSPGPVCYHKTAWFQLRPEHLTAPVESLRRRRRWDFILRLRRKEPYLVLDQSDECLHARIEDSLRITEQHWPNINREEQDRFIYARLKLPSHFHQHPAFQQRIKQASFDQALYWAFQVDWSPWHNTYHHPDWPDQMTAKPKENHA